MTNLIMEEKKPLFNIYFDGMYSLLQKMTDKWGKEWDEGEH